MAGTAVIQGLKLGLGASSLNLGLGIGYKLNQGGQKEQQGEEVSFLRHTERCASSESGGSSSSGRESSVTETAKQPVDWRKVTSELSSKVTHTSAEPTTPKLWSVAEDILLLECYAKYGAQWTLITKKLYLLPGRGPRETAARWQKLLKVTVDAGGCPEKIELAIKLNHEKEVAKEAKKNNRKRKAEVVEEQVKCEIKMDDLMSEIASEEYDEFDGFSLATAQESVSSFGSASSSVSTSSSFPSLRSYPSYTPSTRHRSTSTSLDTSPSPADVPPPPSASTKMSQTVQWLLAGPSQPAGAASLPTYVFKKSRLLSGLESAMPKNCLTVSPEMRMDLNDNWYAEMDSPKVSSPAEFAGHVWMASLEPYKCLAKSFFGVREYTWLASTFNKKWCPWMLWSTHMGGLSPPPVSQSYIPATLTEFWRCRVSLPWLRERAM